MDKTDCFKVDQPREWYLPHHPVVHPHKPGKVRRVLNGAANFHGQSLNSALLAGPDLLQSLIHILFRFRQYSFAVSADIEGMFLQVGVIPRDRPSLQFCGGSTQQLKLLFSSMFGILSAPKIRQLALTTH